MNLHIVTGGSKGLGRETALSLARRGDAVVSISRSEGPPTKGVKYYTLDLSVDLNADAILARIFDEFSETSYERISLINNAGIIDPISKVEDMSEHDIRTNLNTNLHAPIVLTSAFLRHLKDFSGTKVVLNVSSGVTKVPEARLSIYSAAKSGLESFTRALSAEYADQPNFRFFSLDPGVMDTLMQERIRSTSDLDFPKRTLFVDLKNMGQLLTPTYVAEIVVKTVLSDDSPAKNIISIQDFERLTP